jgi:DNA-binding NtrC family response regulator
VGKSDFKILVAEDDEMVKTMIAGALSEEGYSVVAVSDGLAAVKLLRVEEIKLVLADLRMPGADGMEVLRAAVRANSKTAVVVITAYGTLDTTLKAMNEGAYDYIVKPFVMQQLLMVVRNAYERAILIRENEELSGQLRETHHNLEDFKALDGNKRSVLIRENEELSNHLTEAYRNLEIIKALGSSSHVSITVEAIEHIKKMRELLMQQKQKF